MKLLAAIIAVLSGLAVGWAEPPAAEPTFESTFESTFPPGIEPTIESPAPPAPSHSSRPPQPPHAWLGLQVSKPDETTTAHMPSLPPGIGFVIRALDPEGPAKAAGLQELDLLVKLGDQMLVNEGQLAALLRLSKPSDEITLSGFRAGQPLEVKLTLGRAPHRKRPFPVDFVESAILPGGGCGGPMRVVNVAERLASYSTDDGRAVVQHDGELYQVKIHGPREELIYAGQLPADGSLEQIPERWRRRVSALRRGLDQALEGRLMPSRQPRPRVVPPVSANP